MYVFSGESGSSRGNIAAEVRGRQMFVGDKLTGLDIQTNESLSVMLRATRVSFKSSIGERLILGSTPQVPRSLDEGVFATRRTFSCKRNSMSTTSSPCGGWH